MPALWGLDPAPSTWGGWLPVGVGALVALGIALLGWLLSRHRKPPAAPPPAAEAQAPGQDPFTHGSAAEKRRATRRRGNPVRVLIRGAAGQDAPAEGLILDRSMGGLCLTAARPVAVGTAIEVRAAHAPGTVPWVRAEVRNCQREAAGWLLGCAFLKTPPSDVLLSFG